MHLRGAYNNLISLIGSDIDECSLNDIVYNATSGGYYNRTEESYQETSFYEGNYCSMGCINDPPGLYACYCYSGYKLGRNARSCIPDNKRSFVIIGNDCS